MTSSLYMIYVIYNAVRRSAAYILRMRRSWSMPPLNISLTTFPFSTVSSTSPSTCFGSTLPYQIPCPASGCLSPVGVLCPGGIYMMMLPANLCPPIWLIRPTRAVTFPDPVASPSICPKLASLICTAPCKTSKPLSASFPSNSALSSGPMTPQRESLPPWPHISTRTSFTSCTPYSRFWCASLRVSRSLWIGERPSCAECSFSGRRYPLASASTCSKDTLGKYGTYLKLGRR